MLQDRLQPAPFCRYLFAISWAQRAYHLDVESRIAEKLGPVEARSQIYRFSDFSTYYDQELGGAVWKYLLCLEALRPADALVEVKLVGEDIQSMFVSPEDASRRTVNLDPGYLNAWQVVLSSVKKNWHRIYLQKGVFAEVTLQYRAHRYRPLPWTYPDYAEATVLEFLEGQRREYLRQLRSSNEQTQGAQHNGPRLG
jgi:hypothetical protein